MSQSNQSNNQPISAALSIANQSNPSKFAPKTVTKMSDEEARIKWRLDKTDNLSIANQSNQSNNQPIPAAGLINVMYFLLKEKGDKITKHSVEFPIRFLNLQEYVKMSNNITIDRSKMNDPEYIRSMLQRVRSDRSLDTDRYCHEFLLDWHAWNSAAALANNDASKQTLIDDWKQELLKAYEIKGQTDSETKTNRLFQIYSMCRRLMHERKEECYKQFMKKLSVKALREINVNESYSTFEMYFDALQQQKDAKFTQTYVKDHFSNWIASHPIIERVVDINVFLSVSETYFQLEVEQQDDKPTTVNNPKKTKRKATNVKLEDLMLRPENHRTVQKFINEETQILIDEPRVVRIDKDYVWLIWPDKAAEQVPIDKLSMLNLRLDDSVPILPKKLCTRIHEVELRQ